MFKKILIANRGEIACRVMATARRMGIATVAVYSEADRDAPHVLAADEAVAIGPAPSSQSYLVAERLVEACRTTGADAVHPGYGFLSENAAFAEALAAAGVAFIGPPPGAITAMGDKIAAKRLAEAAGVSVIPGYSGEIDGDAHAVAVARDIGYPVMIKASAGGGGKGMRIAWNDDECRDGFARAVSEARSSFGDDRVFVEKFIEEPRHIEIQVLADTHGTIVHLGERECSIQRRHQKVLEESPSPFIDAATRAQMGAQAVALARAVDYCSAGTVEFIVDAGRKFYFLEMNTRLQVEHPVTEIVTGLDLVEAMIRVAAGERLAFDSPPPMTGWAVEARVYAEDPEREFLPSTGLLTRYRTPVGAPGVRVDTGVAEGGEVSMFYDPMVAKIVGHGPDRASAIERLQYALDHTEIAGIAHNIGFLNAVLEHPRFRAGALSTSFIDTEFPDGYDATVVASPARETLVALAAFVHWTLGRRAACIAGRLPDSRTIEPRALVAVTGDSRVPVEVTPGADGLAVRVGEAVHRIEAQWRPGERIIEACVDGAQMTAQVAMAGVGYRLEHRGRRLDVLVLSPRTAELHALMPFKPPADLSKYLLSPMPGLLLSIAVAPGEAVEVGQELAVVEAMKMENVLRAAQAGAVKAVLSAPGDSLAVDQPIIEFE